MPKQPVPSDADPVFQQVMRDIRAGKNPEYAKYKKLTARKQSEVEKALRKRKGKHTKEFRDGVVDTGMFD